MVAARISRSSLDTRHSSLFLALRAGADLPQVVERIEARAVAVGPEEADRIAAHGFDVGEFGSGLVHLEGVRRRGRRLRGGPAGGAGALAPQVVERVLAGVAVVPGNLDAPAERNVHLLRIRAREAHSSILTRISHQVRMEAVVSRKIPEGDSHESRGQRPRKPAPPENTDPEGVAQILASKIRSTPPCGIGAKLRIVPGALPPALFFCPFRTIKIKAYSLFPTPHSPSVLGSPIAPDSFFSKKSV